MRALVLSGGGGKGAYQIGVWKALKRLDINFDIVTGTSIGAINGAFIVSNEYKKIYKVWSELNYNQVFDIDSEESYFNKKGKKKIKLNYVKGVRKGGLNTEALRKTITKNLNIEKFYSSPIDFGLITVNITNKKPSTKTKKNIPKERLIDYLIASSSAFPALQMTEIDNEKYIDGGYYDNMPIDLAMKLGADEIIAIDLKAIGRKIKTKSDIPITIISPKNNLSNFLVMEKYEAKRAMKYGYNDTMKLYGYLDGNIYTFKKNSLNRNYNRIKDRFYNICKLYSLENNKKYIKLYGSKKEIELNNILEDLAISFGIDDTLIYRTSELNIKIKRKYFEYKSSNDFLKLNIKKMNKKSISKDIICYIVEEINKNSNMIEYFSKFFSKNFLCAIYLKTILRR